MNNLMFQGKADLTFKPFDIIVTGNNANYTFSTSGATGVTWIAKLPGGAIVTASGDNPIFNLSANTGEVSITANVQLTFVSFQDEQAGGELLKVNNLDCTNITNIPNSFYQTAVLNEVHLINAGEILSFGSFNSVPIVIFTADNLEKVTSLKYYWQNTPLALFEAELSNADDISYAFGGTNLESFTTLLPQVTKAEQSFINAPLKAFDVDMPEADNIRSMLYGTDIEDFAILLPKATNGQQAWMYCTSLKSFNTDLPMMTNITNSWFGDTALTEFGPTSFGLLTAATNAWRLCDLDQQSVENVLAALDNCGATGLTTHIGNDGDPLSAQAQIHYDNLTTSKGWTINL